MIYLLRGGETKEKIDLLLSLTSIKSDDIKIALNHYYINGRTEAQASELAGVPKSNMVRAMKNLNGVAGIVEQLHEIK